MVWASAKLEVRDIPLMDALSSAAIPRMPEFSAQVLANMAWSLAVLPRADLPFLNAIAASAMPLC